MAIKQAISPSVPSQTIVKPSSNIHVDTYSSISAQPSSSTTTSNSLKTGLSTPATNVSTFTDRRAPTVRRLKASEVDQAAECLAEAFRDDDLAHYFTHTPDRKQHSDISKLHFIIMKCIVKAHVQCGLATTVGENYGCVALW